MNNKICLSFISISGICIIFCIIIILEKICVSKKYVKKLKTLNFKNKLKELTILQKIEFYILKECNFNFFGVNLSPYIICLVSIIFSILTFFISYKYLKIFSSSIILCIYMLIVPFQILKFIKQINKEKIMSSFPTYLAILKNYTKTENDIIIAINKANPTIEIKPYIIKFRDKIQNGIKIYDAFEEMKNSIGILKISEFITALEYCYINGGDFTKLIDGYSKILLKINNETEEEKQKKLGTKLVLIVLIIINIYVLFGFIFSNIAYKEIIISSFIGKSIVNINILSYIIIFFIFQKIEKMEE